MANAEPNTVRNALWWMMGSVADATWGQILALTIYIVSGQDEEVSGTGARAAAAYLKSKGVMAEFTIDETARAKALGSAGVEVVAAALAALDGLPEWTAAAIEAALHGALIDGLGLKPRDAYTPLRVAVTGRTVLREEVVRSQRNMTHVRA